MPRRRKTSFYRDIGSDPVYNSELVQKLINVLMERGKKSIARSIVYKAMESLGSKSGGDKEKTLQLMQKAIDNITPLLEVRARRVGGSVYQVPTEVRKNRARALALRWLVNSAAARSNRTMAQRLASELADAVEGHGGAVKKKIDVYKMAEANRAYSHYAW